MGNLRVSEGRVRKRNKLFKIIRYFLLAIVIHIATPIILLMISCQLKPDTFLTENNLENEAEAYAFLTNQLPLKLATIDDVDDFAEIHDFNCEQPRFIDMHVAVVFDRQFYCSIDITDTSFYADYSDCFISCALDKCFDVWTTKPELEIVFLFFEDDLQEIYLNVLRTSL
jgi:hypothetical protein